MKKNIKFIPLFIILLTFTFINVKSQDIKNNLEAYWQLDCNVNDNSGNNRIITPKNTPQCVDGKKDKAYFFDGKNQYLELKLSDTQKYISDNGFTWSLWIKADKFSQSTQKNTSQTLISIMDNELAQDIYLGFGDINWAERNLVFRVDGAGGAGELNVMPSTYYPQGGFKTNEWYHIAAVMNYKTKKSQLFVNGEKVDEKTVLGSPIKRDMFGSIARAYDGKDIDTAYFNGALDEVRIYSRALTDGEVKLLANLRENQLKVVGSSFVYPKLICGKESLKNLELINEGPTDFRITKKSLKVGKYFSLDNEDGFLSTYSTSDSIYYLPIQFRPDSLGIFYDTLLLENDFGLPTMAVPIVAVKDTMFYKVTNNLVDSNGTIDLGIICPNFYRDFSFNINLITESAKTFELLANSHFEILHNSFGEINPIKGGENRELIIRYNSDDTIRNIQDTISIIDECGGLLTYVIKSDIWEPEYSIQLPSDTLLCPQKTFTTYVNVKNKSDRQLTWDFTSLNPNFQIQKSISIEPDADVKIPIEFIGVENGGLQTCKILFDKGCGQSDSIYFNIDVEYIGVGFSRDTIDFGDVLLCGTDSTLKTMLTFKNSDVSNGVQILSAFTADSSTLSFTNLTGISLGIGEEQDVEVEVLLNKIGEYNNTLKVLVDKCEFMAKLYIKANVIYQDFFVAPNYLLGEFKDGDLIDTTISFVNNGTASFKILDINSASFTALMLNKKVGATVFPQDTIFIRFQGKAKVSFQSEKIEIVTENTCSKVTYTTNLNYIGRYIAKFKLSPGLNSAKTGETMFLNLYLNNIKDLDSSRIDSILIRLRFNKSIMLPKYNKNFLVTNGDYITKEYKVSVSNLVLLNNSNVKYKDNPSVDSTFILRLDTLEINLGKVSSDSIYVETVEFFNGYALPNINIGYFWLSNVCYVDGRPRLIGVDEDTLSLSYPAPNPTNNVTSIHFTLIEDGFTKLEFFDSVGNKVLAPINQYLKAGKYEAEVSLLDLNLGLYFYVLTTPTQQLTKRLQIIR